jgi:hypothetical protein
MEYKAMGLSDFSSPRVFEPVYGTTGHHRMDGILICHGPGIVREGARVEDARIEDLAPTILYLMGQPIPPEMDGRVLLDLFTPEFRHAHTVISADDDDGDTDSPDSTYTQDDEALLTEMLRGLGYVT